MATTGFEPSIHVWSAPAFEEMRTLAGHTQRVNALALSADQRLLASASTDRTVRLWDYASGECLRLLKGHINKDKPYALSLSADGRLVGVTLDHGLTLHEAERFERVAYEKTPVKGMYAVAFSPDGSLVAATSADGKVRVWEVH